MEINYKIITAGVVTHNNDEFHLIKILHNETYINDNVKLKFNSKFI